MSEVGVPIGSVLAILFATYWTVLAAELIGDKTIYTVAALSARFRPLPVLCGIGVAFAGKALAAVTLGHVLMQLPPKWVGTASALTFFMAAAFVWLHEPESRKPLPAASPQWHRALLVAFASVFFSEWGDVGQLSTAALAAKYNLPLVIWIAATLALLSKGALALTLGVGLRKRIPGTALRIVAAASCVGFGVLALRSAGVFQMGL